MNRQQRAARPAATTVGEAPRQTSATARASGPGNAAVASAVGTAPQEGTPLLDLAAETLGEEETEGGREGPEHVGPVAGGATPPSDDGGPEVPAASVPALALAGSESVGGAPAIPALTEEAEGGERAPTPTSEVAPPAVAPIPVEGAPVQGVPGSADLQLGGASIPAPPELRAGQARRLVRKTGMGAAEHHAAVAAGMQALEGSLAGIHSDLDAAAQAAAGASAESFDRAVDAVISVAEQARDQLAGGFGAARERILAEAAEASASAAAQAEAESTRADERSGVHYGRVTLAASRTQASLDAHQDRGEEGVRQASTQALDDVTERRDDAADTMHRAVGEEARKRPITMSGPRLTGKYHRSKSQDLAAENVRNEKFLDVWRDTREAIGPTLDGMLDEAVAGIEQTTADKLGALSGFTHKAEMEADLDAARKGIGRTQWRAKRDLRGEGTQAGSDIDGLARGLIGRVDAEEQRSVGTLDRIASVLRSLKASHRAELLRLVADGGARWAAQLEAVATDAGEQVLAQVDPRLGVLRIDQIQPLLDRILADAHAGRDGLLAGTVAALDQAGRAASERLEGLGTGLGTARDGGLSTAAALPEPLGGVLDAFGEQVHARMLAVLAAMDTPLDHASSAFVDGTDGLIARSETATDALCDEAELAYDALEQPIADWLVAAVPGFTRSLADKEADIDRRFWRERLVQGKAMAAYRAMDGRGTDEAGLYSALDGLSVVEGWAFEAAYSYKEGETFQWWLDEDLDQSEWDAALAYLRGDSITGRMLAAEAAEYWWGTSEGVYETTFKQFRSKEELAALLDHPGYQAYRETLRADCSGTDLAAFDQLDGNNLAGMYAVYLNRDVDAIRADDGDIVDIADAVSTLPPDLEREVYGEAARQLREQGLGVDADGAELSDDEILVAHWTGEARFDLQGRRVAPGKGEGGVVQQPLDEVSAASDLDRDVARSIVTGGVDSLEVGAGFTERELQRHEALGPMYSRSGGAEYMNAGSSGYEGDYQADKQQVMADRWDRDLDATLTGLSGDDLDDRVLAAEATGQQVPLQDRLRLLASSGASLAELKPWLRRLPMSQAAAFYRQNPGLRGALLDAVEDPAERYQLVFLLHGQPADDREFYDLIVRMTDDADLGGFGAHEAQQDFRRVRRALDALVAGRDPAFDDRGYFTGDARGRARFRALAADCEVSLQVVVEGREDDAELLATIAAVTLGAILAPFTGGASAILVAGLVQTAGTMLAKGLMLGAAYSGDRMWSDFVDGMKGAVIGAGVAKFGPLLDEKLLSARGKVANFLKDPKVRGVSIQPLVDAGGSYLEGVSADVLGDLAKGDGVELDGILLEHLADLGPDIAAEWVGEGTGDWVSEGLGTAFTDANPRAAELLSTFGGSFVESLGAQALSVPSRALILGEDVDLGLQSLFETALTDAARSSYTQQVTGMVRRDVHEHARASGDDATSRQLFAAVGTGDKAAWINAVDSDDRARLYWDLLGPADRAAVHDQLDADKRAAVGG